VVSAFSAGLQKLVAFEDVAGVDFVADIIKDRIISVIRFHLIFFQGADSLRQL